MSNLNEAGKHTVKNFKKDQQTVSKDGKEVRKLPDGVIFHEVPTHIDERGEVFELIDRRWEQVQQPIVSTYCFTVRPGKIKGWAVHKKHVDRYFILSGELKVVLYDGRPKSPTYGLVAEIFMSAKNRRLMFIPIGVWHASQNLGTCDVVGINFPTTAYNHAAPDKYRLPIDTDQIPYSFSKPLGW